VADTAAAFVAVGTAPADRVVGRVLNAGTGVEVSIGDLAAQVAAILDRPLRLIRDPDRLRPDSSEVQRLLSDSRELRERTGWAPAVSFDEGLRRTIAWFTEPANLARYPSVDYTI
jgi:nucleoside-diphosphate-sugar epimerase